MNISIVLKCMVVAALISGAPATTRADEERGGDTDKRTNEKKPLGTIAEKTAGLERHDGLFTYYVDHDTGKIWLQTPPPPSDQGDEGERAGRSDAAPGGELVRFLYVAGLARGLGSNPIGLDRSRISRTRLLLLRHVGGRVLLEEENLAYRALTDSAAERRAVAESFATSIIWAGEVAARDTDGALLVDFTSFIVRDAQDVAGSLKRSDQGTFKLDDDRSLVDTRRCLAFPDNCEFEAILTFTSDEPGGHVAATVPDASAVTLVQHHSLIRLPDDAYRPRRFDPRAPSSPIQFMDYGAPLDQPIAKRWIRRHRLEKTDPTAPRSRVKEPIRYYVDPGVPEPMRSALLEGARWWADAFESAGFVDAFEVDVLPEGAHPLDVRYNVIQWVHRSTRGWSYGASVSDPRTGEIIKGHVLLGSLRVRQDRLLFEGLAGTDATGSGRPDDPIQIALARIRQLSAHEVGHTLGFAHNFAASTYADRASVMDYPAPLVRVTEIGTLDFSEAYGVGIGAWDRFAVQYAYSEFAPGVDEHAALDAMVAAAIRDGMLFLSDRDARPDGAAHPAANLWDNGADPVEALAQTLDVRRIALERFGERNIAPGRPLATLQEVLATVYLHHRYQLQAAVKVVGGMEYAYALRGDGQPPVRVIDGATQRHALPVILDCLSPEVLDLPESVLNLLIPRPFGYGANREMFTGATAPAFDALGAAATGADMVLRGLLNPQRCARLVDARRRDPSALGMTEMLDAMIDRAFPKNEAPSPRHAELQRTVQQVVVARLTGLARDPAASAVVRARADYAIDSLSGRIASSLAERDRDPAWDAHVYYLLAEIARHRDRSLPPTSPIPIPHSAPPGSPIGMEVADLGGCSTG
ncbi:MAG: zinc-dependent metalloprotease [Planctomycetes bacterium]|nr:zinc-dependent metalloprotease [Planctomycetota bacterium]